ncbi:MAG: ATP synthase F0 subunit C [Candidatus Nitrospinota bacterium M3_3B_026]
MSKSRMIAAVLGSLAAVLIAPEAFAAEGGAGGGGGINTYVALGCVIGLGLAAAGGGVGMGSAVSGAVSAMSRNPGFYGRIFTSMLIGLALIESLVIYTLVIVLLLLYANPFL